MNRMSPPTGVHASPVATPGTLVRILISLSNLSAPSTPCRSSTPTCISVAVPSVMRIAAWRRTEAHRRRAQHGADLALEIAHAGLARIAVDDRAQGIVVQRGLLGLQAVRFELPRHEIALRDLELFLLRVAHELES